jgi:chromosome segregation ATPase
MGGSPPPPPPPKRQPLEFAKEDSMFYRNQAFRYAIQAASDSYTSAIIVKTLADILLPESEAQLRNEINALYTNVTEYRRQQIIYSTTVQTFLDVDSLVIATVEKLETIRDLGNAYLDNYGQNASTIIENIITLFKNASSMQDKFVEANKELNSVKILYETSSLNAEKKLEIYQKHTNKIQALCDDANSIHTTIENLINKMKTLVDDDSSLKSARGTKPAMTSTSTSGIGSLRSFNEQITDEYTKNIQEYNKELERRRKWYVYYSKKADLVRERNKIVINPAVFRRLMNWAQNAHMNAVYAALYATSANTYAYRDRNTIHPNPRQLAGW